MFKKAFRHLVWGMTDAMIGVLQDHTQGKLARRGRKLRTRSYTRRRYSSRPKMVVVHVYAGGHAHL